MLTVQNVSKRFDTTVILDGVDLTVGTGEVVGLLGPSGSGKSTLLRVIAGLEIPDGGSIAWDGQDLTGIPPHRRRFGLMFQSYALFPHRTVAQNVAFGLRMIGHPDIEAQTRQALEWVGLTDFASRSIDGLSGGEQQRVALARTLAPAPRLVMLDEPLGALDRRLRERLTGEIRAVLVGRGATAIYVTHDHDEAEAVSDRVALMRAGAIVQTGSMSEIRQSPVDAWVADFIA